jgi:hypothetical protein
MSLIEIKWQPGSKELRTFGIAGLALSALIAVLLHLLKGLAIQWALAIFALGLAIFLSSLISYRVTRIIYLALTIVTLPIGLVLSFVLLATFYFAVLTPLGLFFRLIGRDPLRRSFEPDANTYWLTRKPPENLDSYFHQF